MFKDLDQPRLLVIMAILALYTHTGTSLGQSDRDLRAENQRLKTQVKQQQKELDASKAQIAKLNTQVKNLEKALKAARNVAKKPSQQPRVEEKISIDESVATASPRALFSALKSSYEQAVDGLDQGEPGETSYKIYSKAVQRWAIAANREYRAKIVWHVRVLATSPTPKGFAFELQAVDPKTSTKLGDPFFALLSKGLTKRYKQVIRRSGAEVVELKGTLVPNVTFDRSRSTAGPFEKAKFIGPFAQFEFAVDASSLKPPGKEDKKD